MYVETLSAMPGPQKKKSKNTVQLGREPIATDHCHCGRLKRQGTHEGPLCRAEYQARWLKHIRAIIRRSKKKDGNGGSD